MKITSVITLSDTGEPVQVEGIVKALSFCDYLSFYSN